MNLKNTNELLNAQELELVKDFQMEELEERMEMKSWFANGVEGEVGAGQTPPPSSPPTDGPPSTPPPSTPQSPTQGTVPAGHIGINF